MKKTLCILVSVFAICTICNAQLISSKQITMERPHAIWMEIGGLLGSDKYTGDVSETLSGAGFNINLRWTKRYSDYFAMDYFNLGMGLLFLKNAQSSVEPSGIFSLCLGPRGYLPLNHNNSLFLNYNAGIGYYISNKSDGGVAFHHEASLGIEFHKRIALSLCFKGTPKVNNIRGKDGNYSASQSSIGLKFGFSF